MIRVAKTLLFGVLLSCPLNAVQGQSQTSRVEISTQATDTASTKNKEIDDTCKYAETIDLTKNNEQHSDYDNNFKRIPLPENVNSAITRLENLIKKYPNRQEIARAYLLLGKLREKYQNNYNAIKTASGQDAPPPEIAKLADKQYYLYESALYYFYNGWHFDQIIKRFPNSEIIDAAVYEKTFIPYIQCEGNENCWVYSELDPMLDFLNRFPRSSLAPSAIARANKAFDSLLGAWGGSNGARVYLNLEKDHDGYSVQTFKDSITKYENTVKKLAPPLKAAAMDKISEAWERAGEKAKAISAAEYIVLKFPDYSNINSVKDRLQKLKAPK